MNQTELKLYNPIVVSRGKFKLQTHHILPFNTYIEDRFKVDNGIVLCQQCHTNYHARYREHEVNQDTLNMYLIENKLDKE